MRLTLRTLLAYLDGILEPEDAEILGKKIEESTFASDLIHRIRYLLMRPSMIEPGPSSPEPALGPNTVAEYLDNTLTPNHVTEFEKICLDSDIHLAEVASCHQILTLVLGEPAEIDPASRQRMYDVPLQVFVEETKSPSSSESEIILPPPMPVFSTSSIEAETGRKLQKKSAIPDYLREPANKYRKFSIAAAAVVAVCLLAAILFALGRFAPGTTMGNMLVRLGIVQEKKQPAADAAKTGGQEAKKTSEPSAKKKIEQKAPAMGSKAPVKQGARPSKPSATEPPPPAAPGAENKNPTVAAAETPAADTSPAKPSETGAAPETGPDLKAAVPAADEGQSTDAAALPKTTEASKESAPNEPEATKTGPELSKTAEETTIPPSERLGRYMSEDQILLKDTGEAVRWQRATGKEFLTGNAELLALPTYKPDISLAAGVSLRMLGGTMLELTPAAAQEPAGIDIRYGRIVAMPVANAGTRLRIAVGDRHGIITFADPEAVLAVSVRRIHTPGANPETEPALLLGQFFVTSGQINWEEPGQKTLEATGPAQFTLQDKLPAEASAAKDFPKWIAGESMGKLEHDASAIIAESMLAAAADRPAQRSLMELAEHRRKEVRWLAIRSLGYIGHFDSMVTVLDDPEFKLDWINYIEQLREAVARDADTAAAVRKALENRYPQSADAMYRMLWGYTDKDLESGEDAKLVGFLESENLALRVLSAWNLKDITGMGLYYRPEEKAAKRQQPVQNWKQRLATGEIRIKKPEEKAANAEREPALTPPGNE